MKKNRTVRLPNEIAGDKYLSGCALSYNGRAKAAVSIWSGNNGNVSLITKTVETHRAET